VKKQALKQAQRDALSDDGGGGMIVAAVLLKTHPQL
jgi:hypothetical protein